MTEAWKTARLPWVAMAKRAADRPDRWTLVSWAAFVGLGLSWVLAGAMLAPDYPMLDAWRYIPNWILPWWEGDLRPSDLFHGLHPGLGLHLFFVANASWFGFHQKLMAVISLTGGVMLAALLARRIQDGLHGWRAAVVPAAVGLLTFSTAQPLLLQFPESSVSILPMLLVLATADAMFRREWTPMRAVAASFAAGTSIGILFTDPVLVLCLGLGAAAAARAVRVPAAERRVTLLLAAGWLAGAGLAFWLGRQIGGLPPLDGEPSAFGGALALAPGYLLVAMGQGMGSLRQLTGALGQGGAELAALVYAVLVITSAVRAVRHADERAPLLLLSLLGANLGYALFAFVERGGTGGASGEVPRYEVIRMFTSLVVLWAFLHTDFRPGWRWRSAGMAGIAIFVALVAFRLDAAQRLHAVAPALLRSNDVTARTLACTRPDNRRALRLLVTGRAPGAQGTIPSAFRLPAYDEPRWRYLWVDWTRRFPSLDDPDWRVVLLEVGLRILHENELGGIDPSAKCGRGAPR
jgi:hypothetical protein